MHPLVNRPHLKAHPTAFHSLYLVSDIHRSQSPFWQSLINVAVFAPTTRSQSTFHSAGTVFLILLLSVQQLPTTFCQITSFTNTLINLLNLFRKLNSYSSYRYLTIVLLFVCGGYSLSCVFILGEM